MPTLPAEEKKVVRQKLRKKMLDRWENEGGMVVEPFIPADERGDTVEIGTTQKEHPRGEHCPPESI